MTLSCAVASWPDHEAPVYLAVHPAQTALLDDQVSGRLQKVGAEVALLDVLVLVPAVPGPGPGPDGGREGGRRARLSVWDGRSDSLFFFFFLATLSLTTRERWCLLFPAPACFFFVFFLNLQVNSRL